MWSLYVSISEEKLLLFIFSCRIVSFSFSFMFRSLVFRFQWWWFFTGNSELLQMVSLVSLVSISECFGSLRLVEQETEFVSLIEVVHSNWYVCECWCVWVSVCLWMKMNLNFRFVLVPLRRRNRTWMFLLSAGSCVGLKLHVLHVSDETAGVSISCSCLNKTSGV